MQFPIPSRLPLGPLMDFGYEDSVGFPVQIMAAKSLVPGPIHLDARVDWLVCREVCIPGKAHLGLDLNVVADAPPAPAASGALGQALNSLPHALPAKMHVTVNGGKTDFVFTILTGDQETDGEFYPADQDQISNASDQDSEPIAGGLRLRVKRAPDPDHPEKIAALPKEIHGLIKLSGDQAYEISAPVVPGEVAAATGSTGAATSETTAVGAIGLAFLGGIILNLMPCVFPVLFLKGLALVQSSAEERGRMRMHGLVYTLGILVSFWVIVACPAGAAGGREPGGVGISAAVADVSGGCWRWGCSSFRCRWRGSLSSGFRSQVRATP